MKRDDYGVWSTVIPAVNGKPAIPHNSKLKVRGIASYSDRNS
jgi:1,4-alpha-glucan branching enzyme